MSGQFAPPPKQHNGSSSLSGADEALKQVSDVAKQLVSLATAVISGFVAAIAAKLIYVEKDPVLLLAVFFGSLILVIIFSFLLQLSIAGVHDAKSFPDRTEAAKIASQKPSIYAKNIRIFLSLMLSCFVLAMVSLCVLVFI